MTHARLMEKVFSSLDTALSHPETEWFWCEVAVRRERWNPQRHPYMSRWTDGKLDLAKLRVYATEYDHIVLAGDAAAGRTDVDTERDAKLDHVRLWRRFAKAVGWGPSEAWHYAEDPLRQTERYANALRGEKSRPSAARLLTVYAFETSETALCQLRLKGLLERYGFSRGAATEYFEARPAAAAGRAACAQAALSRMLGQADVDALIEHGELVYRCQWEALDALESLAAPGRP